MLSGGRAKVVMLYKGSTAIIEHQINEDGREFYSLKINDKYHTICQVERTYIKLINSLPIHKDLFSIEDYNKMTGLQLSIDFTL